MRIGREHREWGRQTARDNLKLAADREAAAKALKQREAAEVRAMGDSFNEQFGCNW